MKRLVLLALAACCAVVTTTAQTRYLDEVFSSVQVTSNVVYGQNITVLTALQGLPPAPQNLLMDVYQPVGDTETDRPLLLYFHTGNFLPQYMNGSPLGTKTDSAAVEICTRYAKMGYVVASVDYRLGWNPLAATQTERTLQLIQAAYRGVQDSRTAIRFFRKSVAESGDPYGIDGTKIGLIGEGTGGYITLASSTISNYNDIILNDAGAPISKFWYTSAAGYVPMVIESIHGNPDATTNTFAPATSGGFQLCMANHVGYPSMPNFQMNMGGALGDLNWLDQGDVPMVSFQTPHDPFAPYTTGVLVVPTTNELVVEVSGASHIHQEINGYAVNNNAVFVDADLPDPVSAINNGWDGLYPVQNSYVNGSPTEPYDSSPWQWWSPAAVQAYDAASGTNIYATQMSLNPTMGATEGRYWIDQIIDYNSPRMGLALGAITEADLTGGVRYIDEVFEEVEVTSNLTYGQNITVLTALQGLPPAPQNLLLDIYEPAGDTETNRPLILYFHTGNFLPQYINGGATGTKTDSSAVEICKRFARMGYVVASVDYRLGWNPLAATQSERTLQLIQAAYRGVQDSRTAVRFFRKSVAESGNPYGVDPNKIAMFGEGTGGYITMASATISNYNDIILNDAGQPITKFWYNSPGGYIPMVVETIHGNPDATTNTYAPASSGGFQLCMANHTGYSSNINFQINLGGALGDLNWLDQGDVPMISFQAPHDQFAPYTTGVLIVPTTNEPVVEVSGAYHVHQEINGYAISNNASFAEIGLPDPATAFGNQGWDGLYPVLNNYVNGAPTEPYDGSPWQWWDVPTVQAYDAANGTNIAATQLTLNPTMGAAEGKYWIGQIQDYVAPRLAASMDLAELGPGCNDTEACNYNALATTDDGSCTYAAAGFDCDGNPTVINGCTNPIACNYNNAATNNDGSCDYLNTTTLPVGASNPWLVGLTVTGTPLAPYAAGCETNGGVNPNLAVNGVILGNGTGGFQYLSNITDPTGLLGSLIPVASATAFSICGDNVAIQLAGNTLFLAENNGVYKTIVPVQGNQYLWVAPMSSFNLGCGNPAACNFTAACDLSVACTYPQTGYNCNGTCVADTDGDGICNPFEIVGCQNSTADNYNPNATDAGFCQFNGCNDATATNFDSTANTNDGSCTYLVTFRVNMSDVTVNAAGVHIAGSFQGWNPGSTDVPAVGYGVHEVTLQLQAGDYQYKFVNGNSWGQDESVGACGNGGNRTITVGSNATTAASCFGSCNLCPGCSNPMFLEYNPFSGADDGSCLTAIVEGCTYADATNYSAAANVDNGSCTFEASSCTGDLNEDGTVGTPDLLMFLAAFGTSCPN